MKPTKTLPENYTLAWQVDMKKDTRLNWSLQIAGLLWFVVAGWALWQVVVFLRPDYPAEIGSETIGGTLLVLLLLVLLVIFVTLFVHELVHGLCFWLFCRERPVFGIGVGYAYAAAPAWFFPKFRYLVIGLSPLITITIAGLAAIAIVPTTWVAIVFLAVVFNAGGAIGDMYVCMRIGCESRDVLVRDNGDRFEIYRPRVE
jgi:hypothetical protein